MNREVVNDYILDNPDSFEGKTMQWQADVIRELERQNAQLRNRQVEGKEIEEVLYHLEHGYWRHHPGRRLPFPVVLPKKLFIILYEYLQRRSSIGADLLGIPNTWHRGNALRIGQVEVRMSHGEPYFQQEDRPTTSADFARQMMDSTMLDFARQVVESSDQHLSTEGEE